MKKKREYGPILPALTDIVESNNVIRSVSKYGVTTVLVIDTALIAYVLLSIIFRLQLGGLALIDSLPIAMYVLPLFVFLSLVIRAHLKGISQIPTIIVMAIATLVFSIISPLGIGFVLVAVINFISVCWVFLTVTVTVSIDSSKITRRTIAYLIVLNLIGILFPASVYFMGSVPIHSFAYEGEQDVYFDFEIIGGISSGELFNNDSRILQDLVSNQFGLDFIVTYGTTDAWDGLGQILRNVTSKAIPYSITMNANRSELVSSDVRTIGSSQLIRKMYQRYSEMLDDLMILLNHTDILSSPSHVYFDMTLSSLEFTLLMEEVREVDLYGFSGLLSLTISSINQTLVETMGHELANDCNNNELNAGLVVNTFVLDDVLDYDSTIMLACGASSTVLESFSENHVQCYRSSFSNEMNGDVGEYLCYAFSNLKGTMFSTLKLGKIEPNGFDVRSQIVPYEELTTLAEDITIALARGTPSVTIVDLLGGLDFFGDNFLDDLRVLLDTIHSVPITYTFRIYAYRAVIQAIDAFR